MTTQYHRYVVLLRQDDGRPPVELAVSTSQPHGQLWKPTSMLSVITWVTCFLLIVFLVFAAIFSSDSLINIINVEERSKTLPSTSQDRSTISASASQDRTASPPPNPASDVTKLIDFSVGNCNIWRGDWIPHPHEPPYTNTTCEYIQDAQNCMKLGRPDSDYLYWRWKPYDCELPLFDANAFLKIVAGKKWAFIGDSLARNNFQSLLCQLAQVEKPECAYTGWNVNCYFRCYNFTLAVVWAPFLIKYVNQAEDLGKSVDKLYLDVLDESWGPYLDNYDYIVLSAGHWFMRIAAYVVQNELVGCNQCPISLNVTNVGVGFAYRAVLRTVFDFLISLKYKGVVFFRTFSPDHFENAPWNEGGNCTRTAPFKSDSTALDYLSYFMYQMQLEEFGKTVQRSSEFSFKLKMVDTLHAALLRPDAHPGSYGRDNFNVHNDCMHWCLPGPVDAWSAMFLHVLKHL
ncbi:hypothetical protein GOP47_0028135 [Adiantum capillus-veneris]|nr:hypothetical protein GOP47_0028135 [Adiantum capillus-veneris]